MPPNEGSSPPLKLPPMRSRHENDLDVMNRKLPSLSKTELLHPAASAGPYQAPQTDRSPFQVGPPVGYGSSISNTHRRQLDNPSFGGPEVAPAGSSRTAFASGYGSNLSNTQSRRPDYTPFGGPQVPPALLPERSQYLHLIKAEVDAQIVYLRRLNGVVDVYASGISVPEAAKLYNVGEEAVAKIFKELGSNNPECHKKRQKALAKVSRARLRRGHELEKGQGLIHARRRS